MPKGQRNGAVGAKVNGGSSTAVDGGGDIQVIGKGRRALPPQVERADDGDASDTSSSSPSPALEGLSKTQQKKLAKQAAAAGQLNGTGGGGKKKSAPYVYKHAKPRTLTEALFMWELVASFSTPQLVCELERLCKDVAAHLAESCTGTRMMQRYWNAQWVRLVWKEELIPPEKRFIVANSLAHSEGKKNWRKTFVEEYPLWVQRTYQGVGINNNAQNEANALFHREVLNEARTAEELARMELTVEEAIEKRQQKEGVVVVTEVGDGGRSRSQDQGKEHHHGHSQRHGAGGGDGKGKPLLRVPAKDPSAGFTRADYYMDRRQGDRKGKHAKGGDKRWGNYDDFGDYDY